MQETVSPSKKSSSERKKASKCQKLFVGGMLAGSPNRRVGQQGKLSPMHIPTQLATVAYLRGDAVFTLIKVRDKHMVRQR